MHSADIRINTAYRWTVTPTSGCSNQWDLQSVLTHEFGHFFGLLHVSESTHGNLVMSTKINGTCQTNERTLGKGDLRAMIVKYGAA